MAQINQAELARLFGECASSDPIRLKGAEQSINDASRQPDFIRCLLHLVGTESLPPAIKQLAAICFKNHVRRFWDVPEESGGLSSSDRAIIKEGLLDLLVVTSNQKYIKAQLSSAIECVAQVDFPAQWDTLLPNIVERHLLGGNDDLQTKIAALEIADIALQRYRKEDRSNDILSELKYCVLPTFQEPLLAVFKESLRQVVSDGLNGDSGRLKSWFQLLLCSIRIILSLVTIDLPEYIEDHKVDFFRGFLSVLDYQNSELSGVSVDEAGGGLLEEAKAEICKIFCQFALKYCEEFDDFVESCVASVLKLLQSSSSASSSCDLVVSSAMKFLSSVGKLKWTNPPFNKDRLAIVTEYVVLPNLQLRRSDIELMEENPQEFIRRSLEGGESGTRRGSVVELVQSLTYRYDKEIFELLPKYLNSMLHSAATATNSIDSQTFKDAAIYLVIASVVKAESKQFGVSQINPYIDVKHFFLSVVCAELKGRHAERIRRPLAESASLKFVATFRNQLDKGLLMELIPSIVGLILCPDAIVHTHAAFCIENLLLTRELGMECSAESQSVLTFRGTPKFTRQDLKGHLITALPALWNAIGSTSIRENEYPMRCIFKILCFLQQEATEILLACSQNLQQILVGQCQHSNNPVFAHYLFESIGTCIKLSAASRQQAEVEAVLMATVTAILQQQDHDFAPYALQILGLSLDTTTVATPIHLELLNHLLDEQQWTASTAKVPGIVRILGAYFRKLHIFQSALNGKIEALVSRFKYCLNHRRLMSSAFDLIDDMSFYLPFDGLQPFLKEIILAMLRKLQSLGTGKLRQQISATVTLINCRSKSSSPIPCILNAIQAGLAKDFLQNVYVPNTQSRSSNYEKRLGLLSLSKLCSCPEVLGDNELLTSIITGCAALVGVFDTGRSMKVKDLHCIFSDVNRPKRDDAILMDDTLSMTKAEEFQGTFNVLQCAKVASDHKELSEVSVDNFLPNLRRCFLDSLLIKQLEPIPAWSHFLSKLS